METRFDYLDYDDVNDAHVRGLKMQFEGVARYLQRLPPSRALSAALTKLDESFMWAANAINQDRLKQAGEDCDT